MRKAVPGYEGLYDITELGEVFSLRANRQLTPIKNTDRRGYLKVNLSVNGVVAQRYIHQLVLEAFIGDRPEGLMACHNDDDPSNNALSNLRWDTQKANIQDSIRSGKHKCVNQNGTSNSSSKLTVDQVAEIRAHCEGPTPQKEIAIMYDVAQSTVSNIKSGVTHAY